MDLKHVDPARAHGPLLRVWHTIGRSPFGRWYGIHVASPVDAALLRRTGGRVRMVGALPTAVLATTGAHSGAARENPVVYFHDGPAADADVVLVASSFGRDRHPAWFHNLVAHPDVRLNDVPFRAAVVEDPKEYERLFALAVRLYPGFADYRDRTALVGRRIPVLRLTRTG